MTVTPNIHDIPTHAELLTAREVSLRLRLPLPTLYEFSRRDPSRFGVLRFGRTLRFRRAVIERILSGDETG